MNPRESSSDHPTPDLNLQRHCRRCCRPVAHHQGVARRRRQNGRSCGRAEYYSAAASTSNSPKILPAKGKMHMEVQVALNFVISYLYNKLPRRRVNIFGEELEKALKDKFKGHWYPEKPFKGSAFRCLKTGDPVDPVLERAAKESGVPIQDILENLPAELAIWVDPGEVSYRIGEMNAVKILYSETGDPHDESSADREVTKTFNPEAQCFRPIEAVGTSLGGLSLSPKSTSPFPSSLGSNASNGSSNNQQSGHGSGSSSAPSPTPITSSFKGSPSPVPAFIPRTTAPLTFTTATFAQTKFGSTKLKTSSKRANRLVDYWCIFLGIELNVVDVEVNLTFYLTPFLTFNFNICDESSRSQSQCLRVSFNPKISIPTATLATIRVTNLPIVQLNYV